MITRVHLLGGEHVECHGEEDDGCRPKGEEQVEQLHQMLERLGEGAREYREQARCGHSPPTRSVLREMVDFLASAGEDICEDQPAHQGLLHCVQCV